MRVMNTCPNCHANRDPSASQCVCGFMFAPGCLMPLILFSALHVAMFYQILITKDLFPYSGMFSLMGTIFFVGLTIALFKRKTWSIYVMRTSFLLLIVLHIVFIVADLQGARTGFFIHPGLLVTTALRSLVVIYLTRPELMRYFEVKKT